MNILIIILVIISTIALFVFFSLKFKVIFGAKKTSTSNKLECDRVRLKELKDNWYYFFWSNPMRFVWISIWVIFMILLGIAFGTFWWVLASVFFTLLYIPFLIFARKSYKWFPEEAKKRLTDFEQSIEDNIKKEITFDGDNIQVFSKKDGEFDTEPQIFKFPVDITKFDYPLFEKNPKKKPIIKTRKLEFLILSREYFSICKGATPFNLLDPVKAPEVKKCAHLKLAGECHEYYYSQIRNIKYEDEAIKIIFFEKDKDNNHIVVSFKCKKIAPNRKPAMKALKDRLRLTERQRLRKIEEHKHYEDIKKRREENQTKKEGE
ncbi:MAG: hypothetical protein GXO60_03280 [Epsilonproteobacteria bacterium]|nr:hypothetical protein [Campylobacterota bacterium]